MPAAVLLLEPNTSLPAICFDELACEVFVVAGFAPFVATVGPFVGREAGVGCFEGFPSSRLPMPVKGLNFGSAGGSTSAP